MIVLLMCRRFVGFLIVFMVMRCCWCCGVRFGVICWLVVCSLW